MPKFNLYSPKLGAPSWSFLCFKGVLGGGFGFFDGVFLIIKHHHPPPPPQHHPHPHPSQDVLPHPSQDVWLRVGTRTKITTTTTTTTTPGFVYPLHSSIPVLLHKNDEMKFSHTRASYDVTVLTTGCRAQNKLKFEKGLIERQRHFGQLSTLYTFKPSFSVGLVKNSQKGSELTLRRRVQISCRFGLHAGQRVSSSRWDVGSREKNFSKRA